jgi:long-chain fatty acid transport protein
MKNLLFTIFLITTLKFAIAGGFKIGLQGQKQIGMGHVGVGLALDASSVYFNPGALAFTPNNFTFGVTALIPHTQYLDSSTQIKTNTINQTFTPFELYASYGITKKIVAGIGIYTPFGSGVSYPTGWTGRAVLNKISLQAIYFQPTISYKISNHFSAGIGFVYSTGNVELSKDIPLQTIGDTAWGNANLIGNASGMGFNTGLYFTKNKLSAGLVYHSKVAMSVTKGNATFTHIPYTAAAYFPNTTFTTSLPLPSEISIGAAYKLNTKLQLAADINYTFWQSFDSLGFNYATNTLKLTDDKSARLYKNAMAIRLGTQYFYNYKTTMRAGVFYDATPTQVGYVSPELPDANKMGLTAGVSYKITNALSIDASLLLENVQARGGKNIESNLTGTFATKAVGFGVGASYNFNKQVKTKQIKKKKRKKCNCLFLFIKQK